VVDIPSSHPRRDSLLARHKIVEASLSGLLADSAMIAHGRGEAFDYLLGEKTIASAKLAIQHTASLLLAADSPVISVNGNTAVLAGEGLIRVAAVLGCPIEVGLYYRTPERVSGLLALLEKERESVSLEDSPPGFQGDWCKAVLSVSLIGDNCDYRIEGLEGPRSLCTKDGIGMADVVLVPLEDGDRCESLVALDKEICVIDLNPLSRTSMAATVTIVDEVSRASNLLLAELLNPSERLVEWDNRMILRDSLNHMGKAMNRL
jgi:4-phosphopantoate--beta-alanine ligase